MNIEQVSWARLKGVIAQKKSEVKNLRIIRLKFETVLMLWLQLSKTGCCFKPNSVAGETQCSQQ